jgi:hypothetical protein
VLPESSIGVCDSSQPGVVVVHYSMQVLSVQHPHVHHHTGGLRFKTSPVALREFRTGIGQCHRQASKTFERKIAVAHPRKKEFFRGSLSRNLFPASAV